jgi:hypothetical protein
VSSSTLLALPEILPDDSSLLTPLPPQPQPSKNSFDVLMKSDVELQKIDKMEGLSDLKESFHKNLNEVVEALRLDMQARCDEIESQRAIFLTTLGGVYDDSQAWSIDRLKQLSRIVKKFFINDIACSQPPHVEFVGKDTPNLQVAEQEFRTLKQEIGRARSEMESRELENQGSAFKLIDTFEDDYTLRMTSLIEILQDFFQKATTLENQFHEQLKTLAVAAVTNFEEEQGDLEGSDQRDPAAASDGEGSDDDNADNGLSDDEEEPIDAYTVLLGSMDSMMEVVNGSHERHETIILNYDEEVRTSVKSNLSSDLKMYKEKEFSRGRDVMRDILDTTSTLEKSAVDALKMVRHLFDE